MSQILADSKDSRRQGGDSLPGTVSDRRPAPALVLASSLEFGVASQLYERMKLLLEQKSDVDIDASMVERVDACGLQLLLGFVRSANNQNIPVRWKGISPSFLEAAELFGIKTHLGL